MKTEHRPDLSRTVVYAINEPAYAPHRAFVVDQLRQSLSSLRAHDVSSIPTTTVKVFAFGELEDDLAELSTSGVEVVAKGPYRSCLERWCAPALAEVLARYPVLHKWLALAELPQAPGDQILYVDNDTFFFDDPTPLFERCAAMDFYAREEPFSSRSHAGYRSEHIDEPALFALAEAEGRAPLPTYNLGVVLLNNALCVRLGGVLPDFFALVGRFCAGTVRDMDPKAWVGMPWLDHLAANLSRLGGEGGVGEPLAYPSSNTWIVEQLALLLAFGKLAGFSHGMLTQEEVAQGVEFHFLHHDRPLPPLAHYYSSNKQPFFDWWRARARSR